MLRRFIISSIYSGGGKSISMFERRECELLVRISREIRWFRGGRMLAETVHILGSEIMGGEVNFNRVE